MKTPMICFPDSILVNPSVFAISSLNIRTPTEPVWGPKCGACPLAKGFQCATVPKASPLARSRKGPATFSRLHLVKLCWHQKSSATPGCEPSLLRAVLHFDVHWLIASASDWICGPRLRTPGTLAAELRPISQDIFKITPYKSKGHDDDSFQDFGRSVILDSRT